MIFYGITDDYGNNSNSKSNNNNNNNNYYYYYYYYYCDSDNSNNNKLLLEHFTVIVHYLFKCYFAHYCFCMFTCDSISKNVFDLN